MKTFLFFALVAGACSEHGQTPPPWGVPITGGTMLVTRDGHHAVIADPDRDRIVSFDLDKQSISSELALTAGDEPGRLVEDAAGRIHVALRHGGALLTLTNGADSVVADRRYVCAEPRGLAYDAANDAVHVACNGGELVTFAAAGGGAIRQLILDRDLRDVIVQPNGQLIVTTFRKSELLTLDATGNVVGRQAPPTVFRFDFNGGGVPEDPSVPAGQVPAIAAVAWRTIQLPDGKLVMTHQRQIARMLDETPGGEDGGYGGGCGEGPIEASIAVVAPGQAPQALHGIARGALPVDIATSANGEQLALVMAGSHTVRVVSTAAALATPDQDDGCGGGDDKDPEDGDEDLGAPTSVQFTNLGDLVVYYPELPAIQIRSQATGARKTIALTGGIGYEAGRQLFHTQTRVGLACASCHPEGRDDGLVWKFQNFALGTTTTTPIVRRTQSVAGHILERAPYHWTADERDLGVLMDDVFAHRMGGGTVTQHQKESLGPWLDRIPAPSPVQVDTAAATRGAELFNSLETGCVGCHGGDLYAVQGMLADVGKGGRFKVPSLLGIALRAPYMHDGTAATLRDRFGPLGGGDNHGHTSQLTEAQVADLISYLESL